VGAAFTTVRNAGRRTPDAERRTPNVERRTSNVERRTPKANAERTVMLLTGGRRRLHPW
jgi:hypothetical protein